ncbi:MAG: DNA polymerase III subunit beta family protein [Planctomycetota bacterium]|jgi:DNA polymerase-3 subunit beta
MELSCPASELDGAFHSVHAILRERDERQPINYVNICATEPDRASVSAMNDIGAAVDVQIRCKVQKSGTAAFPFRALYRAVGFLGEAQLRILVDARLIAKLRCTSYSAEVAGVKPRHDVSFLDSAQPDAISVRSDELRRALKNTIIAASREDSVLNGVLLEFKPASLCLFASDRTRIAATTVTAIHEVNAHGKRGAVPRRVVDALIALLPSDEVPVAMELTENHATLQWLETTLRAPLYATNFPNVGQVMPKKCEFEATIATARLKGVIGAVAPIATDRHHTVEMTCSGRKLHIRSDSPEIGFAKDRIDLTDNGREFSLAFNAQHLMQFLESVDTTDVVFGVTWKKINADRAAGCMLTPSGRRDYLYYIAPIVRDSTGRSRGDRGTSAAGAPRTQR